MKHRLASPLTRMSRRIGFLAGLIVVLLAVPCVGIAHESTGPAAVHDTSTATDPGRSLVTDPDLWRAGPVLIVTNTTMEMNGSHWRPDALIADPGPDGISLAEALASVNSIATDPNQHETITFDPALMGAVITTTFQLEVRKDGLTLDGDIDDDGVPDIIIEGLSQQRDGFSIVGASHVIVEGLHFRNIGYPVSGPDFGGSGIAIVNNIEEEVHQFENLSIRNCQFTNIAEGAINVSLQDRTFASIHNLEISGNTFIGKGSGVGLIAAQSLGTSDNEISHVRIISNTVIGDGYSVGITIRSAGMPGNHDASRNLVDDIEIRGNTMSGHTNVSILVDAANRDSCNDNTISNLVIAENVIDGTPINIEIVAVGENGTNATGNLITDVQIVDNVFTGGGVQLSGATASGATGNTISNVVVERNHISGCSNNGFIAYAGSAGTQGNLVEDIVVRDNFIGYCTDTGILLDGLAYPHSLGNTIDDVTIASNTIVSNGIGSAWAGGLNINNKYVANVISNITISNTILWGNNFSDALRGNFDLNEVSVAYSDLNDVRFTGSDGNVYLDPKFANPGTGNYRLQPTSPCVDSGDPSGALVGPQDLDRRVRMWDGDGNSSAIVDRGAYEVGAPLMQEMAVVGNGFGLPDGDVVPGPWEGTAFGSVRVAGETVTHAFTISNTGGLTLTLTGSPSVTITGTHASDFTVVTQPASPLTAGESTTFSVVFDPTVKGLRSASVEIDNDDTDEHPYTFALQGIGTQPEISIEGNDLPIEDGDASPGAADGTDFGTANTSGQYTVRSYWIYNTGTTTLTLTGDPAVTLTGLHAADFAVATPPGNAVAPGDETGIWINFTPQAAGLRSATVSIDNNDDDEHPYTFAIQGTGVDLPTVEFSAPTHDVLEDAGTATITVTLSTTSTETVTVDYRTEQLGTATASAGPGDGDYVHTQGQLTFDPGETVTAFGVEIIDDSLFEQHVEGLQLTLENAISAIGTPAAATLRIEDNDPAPIVDFSSATYTGDEDAGAAPITVTLRGATAITATVVVSTTGGTATLDADYVAIHRTLVFTPGVTSQVFAVSIVDDAIGEDDETIVLTLSEATDAVIGTNNPALLTIAGAYEVYLPLVVR